MQHPPLKPWGILFCLIIPSWLWADPSHETVDYVLHVSVDGLRSGVITELGPRYLPNFYRLRNEGVYTDNARTDYDITVTMPNHVCMLTGRPANGPWGHGVTRNGDPGIIEPGSIGITQTEQEWKRGSGALKIDSTPNSIDYIDINETVLIDSVANLNTVVAWYRYQDVNQDGSDTRNFLWETSPEAYSLSFGLRSDTEDGRKHAQWYFQDSNGQTLCNHAAHAPMVDDDQWHHVAVVWNQPAGYIRFYHDGKLADNEGEVAMTLSPLNTTPTGLHIGDYRGGNGQRNWDGYIDDMAVFATELTSDQIASLYQGDREPNDFNDSLIAYWPFDTDYHSQVNDTNFVGTAVAVEGNITTHRDHGAYLVSLFDIIHDYGLSTAFYSGWNGFNFFDRSWGPDYGRLDPIGRDNGRDKIDLYHLTTNDDLNTQTDRILADIQSAPFHYTFIHWHKTDGTGHGHGWTSQAYNQAVITVDEVLGQIIEIMESHPQLHDHSALVLTADHGGTGYGHGDASSSTNYTIPLYVWSPALDLPAGSDLYDLNPDIRQNPQTNRPDYDENPQPIRNRDTANLILNLLGLDTTLGNGSTNRILNIFAVEP